MIRIEFGSGEMTSTYSINPRRAWMRFVARLRRILSSTKTFELKSRTGEDAWLYANLVEQEIRMWALAPETFDQDDYDCIVERRGFTQEEAQTILDALAWYGYRFKVILKPELCKDLTIKEAM